MTEQGVGVVGDEAQSVEDCSLLALTLPFVCRAERVLMEPVGCLENLE